MTTFVLVHGSWGGGWIWSRVAPLLHAAGHEALAPSLTGLADRSHLLTPDVDLETHVEDIAALLRWERLQDVTLVGHSYGGMVIAGALAREPRAVGRMVYVDAFVPEPGQSCLDIVPWAREPFEALAAAHGGRYMEPMDPAQLGVEDAADADWIRERSSLMPLATATQPLPAPPDGAPPERPTTYVGCARPGLFPDAVAAARERGWSAVELDSDHFPLVTQPEALARLLLEA